VSAETIGINFAKRYGIEGTGKDALDQLRALSVDEILDGGQENDSTGARTYSGPILDGKMVVKTAETAYQSARQAKVPLMIGSSSAEIGGGFITSSQTKEELFSQFGELEAEARAAYDPNGDKEFNEVLTKFTTDWGWGEPARMTARAFAEENEPVFVWQFGYVPPAARERSPYGAGHGSETSFVFNTLNARWGAQGEATEEEKELARIMNTYWANFAKTGNPNGNNLPEWPQYDIQKAEIMDVSLDGEVTSVTDPRKARFDVLEKAFKNRTKLQTRLGF
tara:strand:- start:222 stop:1061 length:840 start_codon:yes stop_codon:yes gene_type:complete